MRTAMQRCLSSVEKLPCPCCGYLVFDEPVGSFDICPICDWEDDDVQLRFRYQHAYAAIQCLRMLVPSGGPQAVYCENHEDVVVENADGKFVAAQVKTRKLSRSPFKATDEEFIKAIRRFSRLV